MSAIAYRNTKHEEVRINRSLDEKGMAGADIRSRVFGVNII